MCKQIIKNKIFIGVKQKYMKQLKWESKKLVKNRFKILPTNCSYKSYDSALVNQHRLIGHKTKQTQPN